MDNTFKNMSQLERALAEMKTSSQPNTAQASTVNSPILTPQHTGLSSVKDENTPTQYYPFQTYQSQIKNIPGNSTSQGATHGLLHNLAGLQTMTNSKVDKLTDAIYSLQNCMERIHIEQSKQTELLATIARNTVSISTISPRPDTKKTTSKSNDVAITEYGFSTNFKLLTEFIMSLLKEVKKQAVGKSRQYRITRELNNEDLSRIIKIAAGNKFKINGTMEDEIEMKGNKISSFVEVASKLGTIGGTRNQLIAASLREVFDDPDCGFFVRCVQRLVERLTILRVLIPYYEADIISAIAYPYFTAQGDPICDWSKVTPREETQIEIDAVTAKLKDKEKIGMLLAKGGRTESTVRAVIRSK